MADSNITCSGLTAQGGVGQVALAWSVTDPNADGLPYLALDTVEVWAASTNDRAAATKVAEGLSSALHAGVPEEQSRFYWIRPRSKAGLYGEWHPASAAGGVQGTSTTAKLVRAGTVIGSYIATSESLPRVEVKSDTVQVRVLDTTGRVVAIFGPGEGGTYGDALLDLRSYGNTPAAILSAFENAAGLQVTAQRNAAVYAASYSNSYPAIYAFNTADYFAFYSARGGYGPFTGAHDGLLRSDATAEIGDVLVDLRIAARSDISNTLAEVGVADQTAQRGVIGVLAGRHPITDETAFAGGDAADFAGFDRVIINAVGEGQINVCADGGPIEAGDLLCASGSPGKAMRQPDDIVRSTTVARAREASNGRSQIACIYLAG